MSDDGSWLVVQQWGDGWLIAKDDNGMDGKFTAHLFARIAAREISNERPTQVFAITSWRAFANAHAPIEIVFRGRVYRVEGEDNG